MSKPRVSDEQLKPILATAKRKQKRDCIWLLEEHMALDLIDTRRDLAASQQRCRELEARYRYRPVSEAHEDFGPCVYIDIADPGLQVIAHVCDVDYEETIEGMTHFAQLPELTEEMVQDLIAAQRQKEGE